MSPLAKHREKGWELCTKLYFEAAQLDVLASYAVQETAHELVDAHNDAYMQLISTNIGETAEAPTMHHRPMDLHEKLALRMRQDFGIDNKSPIHSQMFRRSRARSIDRRLTP